jgi:hypothetical protein
MRERTVMLDLQIERSLRRHLQQILKAMATGFANQLKWAGNFISFLTPIDFIKYCLKQIKMISWLISQVAVQSVLGDGCSCEIQRVTLFPDA